MSALHGTMNNQKHTAGTSREKSRIHLNRYLLAKHPKQEGSSEYSVIEQCFLSA